MGKSIDVYKCERCGNQVYNSVDTSIGDIVNFCASCGWENSSLAMEDENGNLIPDKDGYIIFEYLQNDGFGVLNLEYKNGTKEFTAFEKVPSNEEIVECLHRLNTDDTLLIDNCYFTVWNETDNKLDVLFGFLSCSEGDDNVNEEDNHSYLLTAEIFTFDDIPF